MEQKEGPKFPGLTRAQVAYDVEQALLWLDRGLFSAVDRVVCDLNKDGRHGKWTRRDVFHFLAVGYKYPKGCVPHGTEGG